MQSELFSKYLVATELTTKAVRKTERGELVLTLMNTLNLTRTGKFKPLTMPRMGLILEKIPTDALYTLLSKCKEAGEVANNRRKFAKEEDRKKMDTYESAFSKCFWYQLRPR